MRAFLRQIVDIQVQAERVIQHAHDRSEIEQFARYNSELRNFLLANITEGYLLDYAYEIPELNLEEPEVSSSGWLFLSASMVGVFLGILGLYHKERRVIDAAKEVMHEIKGKYASLEFMIRNAD